jgi:hypothetical protein
MFLIFNVVVYEDGISIGKGTTRNLVNIFLPSQDSLKLDKLFKQDLKLKPYWHKPCPASNI